MSICYGFTSAGRRGYRLRVSINGRALTSMVLFEWKYIPFSPLFRQHLASVMIEGRLAQARDVLRGVSLVALWVRYEEQPVASDGWYPTEDALVTGHVETVVFRPDDQITLALGNFLGPPLIMPHRSAAALAV